MRTYVTCQNVHVHVNMYVCDERCTLGVHLPIVVSVGICVRVCVRVCVDTGTWRCCIFVANDDLVAAKKNKTNRIGQVP